MSDVTFLTLSIAACFILLFVIMLLGYMFWWRKRVNDAFGIWHEHDTTVMCGLFFGTVLLAIALASSVCLGAEGPLNAPSLTWCILRNVVATLIGGIIGGSLGLVISPFNKRDERAFSSLVKAASAFASGFLLSKLNQVFEIAIASKWDTVQYTTILCAVSFIALSGVFILTFVPRNYGRKPSDDKPNTIKTITVALLSD